MFMLLVKWFCACAVLFLGCIFSVYVCRRRRVAGAGVFERLRAHAFRRHMPSSFFWTIVSLHLGPVGLCIAEFEIGIPVNDVAYDITFCLLLLSYACLVRHQLRLQKWVRTHGFHACPMCLYLLSPCDANGMCPECGCCYAPDLLARAWKSALAPWRSPLAP